MSSLDFIDEVKIYLRAGHGGPGALHFRREKFVPKGGPDGGNGGRGGHIIFRGDKQLSTLLHLKYKKHIIAEDGQAGSGGRRTGADGTDKIIAVPLGTTIRDPSDNKLLADITQEGIQVIVMPSGRGGLGNFHFKTATNQAPRYAQPGESGQEGLVKLELTLVAQVGLVGLPNAGKSTLLASLSAAKPRIANYPFTTLVPQLGVVAYRDEHSFVLADMPGIIEGAASGKGLGIRFLRHMERTTCLVFVLAADTPHIDQVYTMLMKELAEHTSDLTTKSSLFIISKTDLIDKEQQEIIKESLPPSVDPIFISAMTGQGLSLLKDKIWQILHNPSPTSTLNEKNYK